MTGPEPDHLALFLDFADKVQAAHEKARRPAYAETCACGASVEASIEIGLPELRRIRNHFQGRHRYCGQAVEAPVMGQIGGDQ